MVLDRDRDFLDMAEEADARRAARRVSLVGGFVVLILGFGLISLLMYGRILTDNNVIELTAPAAVTVPQAQPKIPTPTPTVPAPNAP